MPAIWTDSYAAPDLRQTRSSESAAPATTRVTRVARLVSRLAAMWLTAVVLPHHAAETSRRNQLILRWSRRMLDAAGVRVIRRGFLPRGDSPALYVANHISWLDPYVLGSVIPLRFVAKQEVAGWPVVGIIARRFGSFFIRRGSFRSAARVKDELVTALRNDDAVAAFPEATTTDGVSIRRFFPALFQSAVDAGVPIYPVAIRYRDSQGELTRAAAFIDDMTILDSLRRVLTHEEIVVELTFCPPLPPSTDRKRLARLAQESVAAALRLYPPHAISRDR